MATRDPIRTALDQDEAEVVSREAAVAGGVGEIVSSYTRESDNLLGFVLNMSYEDLTVVTCDAWKRKCGGVPKNSFVIVRINPAIVSLAPEQTPTPFLILGRITEAAPVPLSQEVQQTIFQIHKVQAALDPYTDAELQWGALKAKILGTYYDENGIDFGNDIDSYVSPHFYEVYVPLPHHLEILVNSFVSDDNPEAIGHLRYTESRTIPSRGEVSVKVAPHDFVSNRTALFGKTRMGKSNTIKVIADMMLRTEPDVGQIIFDLDGEYSNPNEQDGTSLFQLHTERCIRYSLNPSPRDIPDVDPPRTLKVNFFGQVVLGHAIMTALWDAENTGRPNYVLPLLEWEPVNPEDIDSRFPDQGDRQRYRRAQSMYFAALAKANFTNANPVVPLVLNAGIKQALAQDQAVAGIADMETGTAVPQVKDRQRLQVAIRIYEVLWALHTNQANAALFPPSQRTGKPYLDPVHTTLLRMMGDRNISGTQYLLRFAKYHDTAGSNVLSDIVREVDAARTVIIDLANADEVVARFYSELVSKEVLRSQMRKFTAGTFEEHSVLFYFEEAHNLFRRDDHDLTSVYNRLAKEGAKFRIGMVYATQSMTTLSPDLLKNSENFFIAHLSDDREIRELTNRYEFKDLGLDIQRSKTKGFVRLITLSHRYALPVQIRRFGGPLPADRRHEGPGTDASGNGHIEASGASD